MGRGLIILLIFAAVSGIAGSSQMFVGASLSVLYGDPVMFRFNDYGEALLEVVLSLGVLVLQLVAVTLGIIYLLNNRDD